MSGHSHWKGIKNDKEVADKKRGKLFSKLLKAISIAAKTEPNPQFNPRLRTAVETARENNVPSDNIERAIKSASETKNLEEIIIGAYGPEGAAILIEAITDNKNRTIPEIKNILNENQAKFTEPESILWAFEKINLQWQAKLKQPASEKSKNKISKGVRQAKNKGTNL